MPCIGRGIPCILLLLLPLVLAARPPESYPRLPNDGKHPPENATDQERTEFLNVLRGFAEGWLREVLKVDVIEELDSAYGVSRIDLSAAHISKVIYDSNERSIVSGYTADHHTPHSCREVRSISSG